MGAKTEGVFDLQAFGRRLQQVIFYRRDSQKTLAAKTRVSTASISYYLRGSTEPPVGFIASLAKAYPDINLKWILTGIGEIAAKDGVSTSVPIVVPSFEKDEVLLAPDSTEFVCAGPILPAGRPYFAVRATRPGPNGRFAPGDIVIYEATDTPNRPGTYLSAIGYAFAVVEGRIGSQGLEFVSESGATVDAGVLRVLGVAVGYVAQI